MFLTARLKFQDNFQLSWLKNVCFKTEQLAISTNYSHSLTEQPSIWDEPIFFITFLVGNMLHTISVSVWDAQTFLVLPMFFDVFNHRIETIKFILLHTLLPRHKFQIYSIYFVLWTRSYPGPALKGGPRLTYRKYRRGRVAAATKERVGKSWKMVVFV